MSHVVLVHGAWAGAWVWDTMLGPLRAAGHTPHPLALPGVGTWGDDDVTLDERSLFSDVTLAEARVSNTARYTAPFVPAITFAADADTLALYAFDEGAGTTIADGSVLGLDGSAFGDPVWGSYCYQP